MRLELWEHQKEAVKRASKHRDFALFFDMGAGKTGTLINILRANWANSSKRQPVRTLVLAPRIVLNQWRSEFSKFSKLDLRFVHALTDSGVKCIKVIDTAIKNGTDIVFIINYEKLVKCKGILQALLDWCPDTLVCDESHKLKNPQAAISNAVEKLSRLTNHNYILTGTPVLNTPLDLYQQFKILDNGETFHPWGENFYIFRSKYFVDVNEKRKGTRGYYPLFQPRKGTFKELNERVYKKAMRVTKAECMDLPPLVKQVIEVEMSPDQKKAYEQMRDTFIAYLESGDVVEATNAISKAIRLQQIVTGYTMTTEDEVVKFKKNNRIQVLRELLETITKDNQVIVWACFRDNYADIEALCQKMSLPYSKIVGSMTNTNRDKAQANFKSGASKVLIANQSAAGTGVNLVEASYAIYYSKNFSLGDDIQSEARNHRGGSEVHKKITRIDIVTPKTIDEFIMKSLSNKVDISEKILHLKKELLSSI